MSAFVLSGVSCPKCPHLLTYMRARQAAFETVRQGLLDSDSAGFERGMKQLDDAMQSLERAMKP